MTTATDQKMPVATTKAEKPMEFVPFGAKASITLTIKQVQNLVAVKTRSGKTCSETDAIKFMMMCQARLLNPYEGDAYLIGYDGKDGPTFSLITAHQAFLKRAELNPEYNGMKSGIIIKDADDAIKDIEGDFHLENQTVLGGWATVFFKNRDIPMHKRVRLKRFQKSFGVWQDDSAGMICKCAEADALRSSFPTMLGGLYLREEMQAGDPPRHSTPLFKTKEQPPIDASVVSQPVQPGAVKGQTPSDIVRANCARDGVSEDALVQFLVGVGLADDGNETLEQVAEDNLRIVIDQWDEMSAKVKEQQ